MPKAGKLEESEIAKHMESLVGWSVQDGKLHKEFTFTTFADAFAFMTRIAFLAEKLDHHPDWSNSFTTVIIDLSSHDVGGISERDFGLAAAIDGL